MSTKKIHPPLCKQCKQFNINHRKKKTMYNLILEWVLFVCGYYRHDFHETLGHFSEQYKDD